MRQGVVGQGRDSVYYLHSDHLGSTSEVTSGTAPVSRIAQERYYPYGQVRWGSAPTSYNYSGQRLDGTGLLYYGARYYDPRLARFVQADTVVPEPGNPQALNRYAYGRNNPVRYTDPTGHWTEDELEQALGESWFEIYFGQGGVFEGRDKLLAFLQSDKTTEAFVLDLVRRYFEGARDAHSILGIDFGGIDAISARWSFSGQGIFYGEFAFDAVLNLTAGQFSFFFSRGGGVALGTGLTMIGGWAFLQNTPTNDQFRGVFESLGVVAAGGFGGNLEGFWNGPKDDWFNYSGEPNGYFAGVGIGDALAVYGTISYSIELFREDVGGAQVAPYQPNLPNAPGEILWALLHDVLLNPIWPWSPYRR